MRGNLRRRMNEPRSRMGYFSAIHAKIAAVPGFAFFYRGRVVIFVAWISL
jgi:hypothetical protein